MLQLLNSVCYLRFTELRVEGTVLTVVFEKRALALFLLANGMS